MSRPYPRYAATRRNLMPGGDSPAYAFGGAAQIYGLGAIRVNPAMMTSKSQYKIAAGYHWPTQGREFYHLGILDSKTSKFSAGVLWSSHIDHIEANQFTKDRATSREHYYDSPIKRRVAIGLAHSLGSFSLGVNGQYIEYIEGSSTAKGIGFGLGAQALGGMLAGGLLGCVSLALMMANAGGAWDNAKKYVEKGNLGGKGSDTHAAAVVGDTVGDPFKDTSGPSMNILINVMAIVSLVIAPLLSI